MQLRMLPDTPKRFDQLTLSYELYSAGSLSGDFVDFAELPDRRVAFLVADVAGHGAGAALVTVVLKSFMSRLTANSAISPASLLAALNTELCRVNLDRHVSALLGVVQLDNYRLTLAGAGAFPLPLYWQASAGPATAQTLKLTGKALGLFDSPQCSDRSIRLAPGDRLTVVTDGVLELLGRDQLDELELRLAQAAALPVENFWRFLGVAPANGGVDDTTRFTLEWPE